MCACCTLSPCERELALFFQVMSILAQVCCAVRSGFCSGLLSFVQYHSHKYTVYASVWFVHLDMFKATTLLVSKACVMSWWEKNLSKVPARDSQCGLAVSSFGWTLAMLSVQLWLSAFDCSSDKCVSSRIASRFTTCSQMRLFTLMILSVSCVDASPANLMFWNERFYIICESHESSVFHFSGRSLL